MSKPSCSGQHKMGNTKCMNCMYEHVCFTEQTVMSIMNLNKQEVNNMNKFDKALRACWGKTVSHILNRIEDDPDDNPNIESIIVTHFTDGTYLDLQWDMDDCAAFVTVDTLEVLDVKQT